MGGVDFTGIYKLWAFTTIVLEDFPKITLVFICNIQLNLPLASIETVMFSS